MSGNKYMKVPVNFQSGLDVINSVDSNKFRLFLNRIAQDIQANPDSNNPFNEEQENKLLASFDLDREKLNILTQSAIYIIRQAIHDGLSMGSFKDELSQNLKLTDEKVVAFLFVWSKNAKGLIKSSKEKSIFSRQLEDISWLVDIEVASDKNKETFASHSILQLNLKENSGKRTDVILDLNEPALVKLFEALENVQDSLDELC
ncbi:HCaRG protein [Nesidiocoris tenuis]|uniref:HCaRG protein n=1 Tax=Nesidiocoris tenuis TaxID=355587 RepID=A0ABN7B260_9HEMI|nr:HCaRG protein [Nesidiocoris tenuis]